MFDSTKHPTKLLSYFIQLKPQHRSSNETRFNNYMKNHQINSLFFIPIIIPIIIFDCNTRQIEVLLVEDERPMYELARTNSSLVTSPISRPTNKVLPY